MSEYNKLKNAFDGAVRELRKNCSHSEISDWIVEYREPGHIPSEVRYCKYCGLKVAERGYELRGYTETVEEAMEKIAESIRVAELKESEKKYVTKND